MPKATGKYRKQSCRRVLYRKAGLSRHGQQPHGRRDCRSRRRNRRGNEEVIQFGINTQKRRLIFTNRRLFCLNMWFGRIAITAVNARSAALCALPEWAAARNGSEQEKTPDQ